MRYKVHNPELNGGNGSPSLLVERKLAKLMGEISKAYSLDMLLCFNALCEVK